MTKGQRIEFLKSENDINCLVEAKISILHIFKIPKKKIIAHNIFF